MMAAQVLQTEWVLGQVRRKQRRGGEEATPGAGVGARRRGAGAGRGGGRPPDEWQERAGQRAHGVPVQPRRRVNQDAPPRGPCTSASTRGATSGSVASSPYPGTQPTEMMTLGSPAAPCRSPIFSMKKRSRTLTSFFSPAPTPVMSTVQPNINLSFEPTVGTGASNNVTQKIAAEATVEVVERRGTGNTSQEDDISTQVLLTSTSEQKINDIREHGWEELFEDAKSFCLQHNIIVPDMLDTTTARGRSRGRGGQLITYYHHFNHEIFIVVLDQLIVELNNRFGERSTQLLKCIACLDPRNSFANFDGEKLIELAKLYAADFSPYDCIVLKDQLDIFIDDMRADSDFINCNDIGDLAVKMVQSDRHIVFPFVYRLIELALILPVATVSVERAFLAMSIIKTELQNKTGDEWLNHRMVCYIERDIFASIEDEKILRHFQDMGTQKMKLPGASGSGTRSSVVDLMRLDGGTTS